MDYNFWDDRTIELYYEEGVHPCYGCCDFRDGECLSNGGCAQDKQDAVDMVDKLNSSGR